jgi:glycosyltransferase involved in cell wall biosynthesis
VDTPRQTDTAMFMGDYKYFPNTDAALYFIKEIMPLIRAKRPDFKLNLVGKDPTPELVALSNNPNSGVTATGLVDDTRPYLTQSTVFVCPLRSGSGTRFKLLEALACGLPVVSTSIGSEGLVSENSDHMILADTPQAFADVVLKVLSEPETAANIGREGRKWVVESHAWERSATQIAAVYRELITKNS